jgi:DNA-binding IclR family transcriptional regulator
MQDISSREEDVARVGARGSLARGVAILGLFRPERRTISVGEMAREIGVHRSTASRLAALLMEHGILEVAQEKGTYRLGRRLIDLGELSARNLDLRETVVPLLQRAVDELGDTAHIGVLEADFVQTVAVVDGWQTIRMHASIGKRSPAHASSLGKAILAAQSAEAVGKILVDNPLRQSTANTIRDRKELYRQLEEIRVLGYSIDREELELGLVCIGAPIFGRSRKVIAAISISGPTARMDHIYIERVARWVRWTAFVASQSLGCPGDSAALGSTPVLAPS